MRRVVQFHARFSVVMLIIVSLSMLLSYMMISYGKNQAFADAYVRMQNGRKVSVAPDGSKVVITNWDEHAVISQSITYNGLTRFAMVSDNAQVVTNLVTMTSGTLALQYLIGCQFPESSAQVNAVLNIYPGQYHFGIYPTPNISATAPATVAGGVYPTGISLTPGQVTSVTAGTADITNGSALIQIIDFEITANDPSGQIPCAGYAQARSFQQVDITSGIYSLSTALYGQPFGLG